MSRIELNIIGMNENTAILVRRSIAQSLEMVPGQK